MTPLEQAEFLFDEAERQSAAAQKAERNGGHFEAERRFQRVRECRRQADQILDQVLYSGRRIAS